MYNHSKTPCRLRLKHHAATSSQTDGWLDGKVCEHRELTPASSIGTSRVDYAEGPIARDGYFVVDDESSNSYRDLIDQWCQAEILFGEDATPSQQDVCILINSFQSGTPEAGKTTFNFKIRGD